MNRVLLLNLILLVSSGCQSTQPKCPPVTNDSGDCRHDNSSFRCVHYLKNYDGDTVTVRIPDVHPLLGETISVRIRGIDSAEKRGKTSCERTMAIKAQLFVNQVLSAAKRINLTNIGRDKYFRILANIEVDGVNLADLLTERSLSVPYDGGRKLFVDWCQSRESSNAPAKHR